MREETFKEIYARFFPRGADSSQYAHYVFNTFDQDSSGALSFEVGPTLFTLLKIWLFCVSVLMIRRNVDEHDTN